MAGKLALLHTLEISPGESSPPYDPSLTKNASSVQHRREGTDDLPSSHGVHIHSK